MDKYTALNIDNAWKDRTAAKDKAGLAGISHKLISLYELGKLWLSLKDGDNCLVLHKNGSIYRGNTQNVKLEKMHKLQEAYKTEEHIEMGLVSSDMKSAEEMYPIAFNGVSSAKWDTRVRLASDSPKRRGRKPEPVQKSIRF